ncbi:hypothetical protein GCM10009642_32190 [Nocardiopsis metallicus]
MVAQSDLRPVPSQTDLPDRAQVRGQGGGNTPDLLLKGRYPGAGIRTGWCVEGKPGRGSEPQLGQGFGQP